MFAIRSRRKVATERDFLDAVEKVVRQGTKFSSTQVADIFTLSCLFADMLICLGLCTKYTIRGVRRPLYIHIDLALFPSTCDTIPGALRQRNCELRKRNP